MTKDEFLMTKEFPIPKSQSRLVLAVLFVIRHSPFVI